MIREQNRYKIVKTEEEQRTKKKNNNKKPHKTAIDKWRVVSQY